MTPKLTRMFALFRPCSKTDARCQLQLHLVRAMPRDRVGHLWVLHAKSVPRNGLWERGDLEFDADEPEVALTEPSDRSFQPHEASERDFDKKRASSFQLDFAFDLV